VYFYNTNWFQSSFLYNRFYQPIYDAPFDATQKGATASIPLTYKFHTCYDLALTVPGKSVFHDDIVGPGALAYRFISNGKVLKEGLSFPADKRQLMLQRSTSVIPLMLFDLPFPEADDELQLDIRVVSPFDFLKPFAGGIRCRITPDYDSKFGGCHSEDLRIAQ